jgi:hypothetical protein
MAKGKNVKDEVTPYQEPPPGPETPRPPCGMCGGPTNWVMKYASWGLVCDTCGAVN